MSSTRLLTVISYFSVCIPFFAGLFTFKKADKSYRPFFYFLLLITLSDLAIGFSMVFFTQSYNYPIIIGNINSLVEAFVITWLLNQWQVFEHKEMQYKIVLILYLAMWLIETVHYGIFRNPNRYFPIASEFVIGLLVISLINKMVATEKKELLLNPKFFICIALIVYHCLGIIPAMG